MELFYSKTWQRKTFFLFLWFRIFQLFVLPFRRQVFFIASVKIYYRESSIQIKFITI